MNRKFIFILVIILILIVAMGCIFYFWQYSLPKSLQNNVTYPEASKFTFYPIHEIKLNKFSSGNYNTEGYVVEIYTCPICPKGAFCKTCMGDNIIISEDSKLAGNSSLFDKEMILFANNPQQFELGKKYNFSIKILNTKYAGGIINDAELIGYNLQIGKLEQNQNGNFILYVSNQSSAIDPVDIKIFIDGEVVVEQNFSQNGGHNWKKFQLSLSKGIHSIYAVSIKGEVKLEKEFEVKDKHWVAIDYGYFPLLKPCSSNYCGEFTPRQFNFDMRDEPIYFE